MKIEIINKGLYFCNDNFISFDGVNMSDKIDSFSTIPRWRPDFRYTDKKFIDCPVYLFKSTEPSVTDKEAYRLTLASLRGQLAQGTGKIDVGSYSLKPGEEYDPSRDFSFLNRKDLTIVELDERIKVMKRQLEEADEELSVKIKSELASAEKKRQTLEKETVDKNDKVSE